MKIHRNNLIYFIIILSIFLLAGVARFYDLGLRPLHHDEGANAHFMMQIFKGHTYRYDPCNYHGPLLYYLTYLPLSFCGMDGSWVITEPNDLVADVSFRFMPALLGVCLLLLLPAFRKWLGRSGVILSMLLLAVSPAFVYYSRDNIHEMYLMFFTLLTFLAGYRFYLTRHNEWLYGVSIGLAGMFALKETSIITVIAWCGALGLVGLMGYLRQVRVMNWWPDFRKLLKAVGHTMIQPVPLSSLLTSCVLLLAWLVAPTFVERRLQYSWITSLVLKGGVVMMVTILFASLFAVLRARLRHVILCVLVFLAVISVLFTTFFNWSSGIAAFFRAFELWFTTGTVASQHNKPFVYFFQMMMRYETPIILFGLCGILFGCRQKQPVTCFVSVWALALFLMYSLIPYKTPWLVLNSVLPLALLSGVFIHFILQTFKNRLIQALVVVLLIAVCVRQGVMACELSFDRYDDDGESLVYVQTTRDARRLINRVFELAPFYDGLSTRIISVTPDYWPLPWYFRSFSDMLWYGQMIEVLDAPMVLARVDQQDLVESRLKEAYNKENYHLRPGVSLVLYHRTLPDEIQENRFSFTNTVSLLPGQEVAPGLIGTLYRGAFFAGKPIEKKVDTYININWADDMAKPCKAPLSIEWKGLLFAPAAGRYALVTLSDDGSWIYVDDQLVVDNGGEHGVKRKSQTIYLSMGYHHITVRYFDSFYGAVMQLKWRPPNQPEAFITNNLFHVLPF